MATNTEEYMVGLEPVEAIPEVKLPPRGKVAEIQGKMQTVINDSSAHGRPWRVGSAPADTNAANRLAGAKATLRAKFGAPEVYGYIFQLSNEQLKKELNGLPAGTPMKSLFFIYDPSQVVNGKATEHETKQAEQAAKAKAKAAAK